MQYGSQNNNIVKDSNIGKVITNGTSDVGNYRVFAITLKINANSTNYYETYVFTKGYVNTYFFEVASYWCHLRITLSSNTFSIYSRRAQNLNTGMVTAVASIEQIRGLG